MCHLREGGGHGDLHGGSFHGAAETKAQPERMQEGMGRAMNSYVLVCFCFLKVKELAEG